jgi:ribosomal protein S25
MPTKKAKPKAPAVGKARPSGATKPKARPKRTARPSQQETEAILSAKWDEIRHRVSEGEWLTAIAEELKVEGAVALEWIDADAGRARAYKAAVEAAAEAALREAERNLRAAGTPAQISKARDLATHLRWVAARRNSRRFGDKLDVTSDGQRIARSIDEVDAELHSLLGVAPRPESTATRYRGAEKLGVVSTIPVKK